MRRDKKAAQKKKARANAKKKATSATAGNFATLVRLARESEFGPAFMSPEWRDDELPPRLVTVVITRLLPKGALAFHSLLVDRTCLGVKNAFTHAPISRIELDNFLAQVGMHHNGPMEEVPLATAQSVVYHALDFASELGFEPNEDFDPAMVGPRPAKLEETPLCDAEPFYVPGPDDDADAIIEQLEEAVGEDGFEVGDEDDDLDEPEPTRKDDEQKLFLAIQTWLHAAQAEKDGRWELMTAFAEYVEAATGKSPDDAAELAPELMSSLPLFWAGLFRPIGGRTGVDEARKTATAEHRAELDRVARSRAALFDVLDIDTKRGLVVGRDVFDGTMLEVRVEEELLSKLTRWTRMFGYMTPMDDGTWYPPSTLLGHPWLRNVDPVEAIAQTNALLEELEVAERIDPKQPQSGFLRYGALVHGVLHRSIAPTAEQRAEAEAPIYCVNSDGERYEPHDGRLSLSAADGKKLVAAVRMADDFVEEESFVWTGRRTSEVTFDGEALGNVFHVDRGELRVVANSRNRFERLLLRLSSLLDKKVEPKQVAVTRPWEMSDRAVAEEVPGCRTVIVGLQPREAVPSLNDGHFDHVRRTIAEDVPSLGGRPIDLVNEEAGRDRVEAWLRDQELHGVEGENEPAFLDLDDVRRELGIPTVR